METHTNSTATSIEAAAPQKLNDVRELTADEVEAAIKEIPAHRTELKRKLEGTLNLINRGIPIKSNAPIWIQARNAVFAYGIDKSPETDCEQE